MTHPPKRLGRGLASLLAQPDVPAEPAKPDQAPGASPPATLPIDQLQPNHFQARQVITSVGIQSLAKSLRSNGMIQPIIVRPFGRTYQIVAGERRWHAARAAGWTDIPVIIADFDERQMLEAALIENIHREDLNAIDRARGYARYAEEFGLSAEHIAERTGEDRTTVTNYLRLLELDKELQQWVADGRLGMGHARALLGMEEPKARRQLAKRVIARELSVRAVEELVRTKRAAPPPAVSPGGPQKRPHIRDLEERLQSSLGLKVLIEEGRRRHSGRVVIHYASLDDFDRLTDRLGVRVGSD